jgi:YebC/PmpR family DNA-binding regulatory protein
MAGHSKWATTKRHKAVIDAKRGKIFSALAKDITVAAREGGGDINFNPRLRNLVAKAKVSNMPNDNIDRAIKKGTGELPGVEYFQLVYEAYAPGGVGVIVEVTTDNKNRAASDVRSTFTKCGGNLATPGALQHSFTRLGQFLIDKAHVTEERLMEIALEAGADDVIDRGDHFDVRCQPADFDTLTSALEAAAIPCASSELAYVPNSLTQVTDADAARKVNKLLELLEDLEDVQNVFDNSDIDDALLAS